MSGCGCDGSNLHPVDEVIEHLLSRAPRPPKVEQVALADALGRVLAEDLLAPSDVPAWDNSAMDGYALRARDLPIEGGFLPLAGRIAAGDSGLTPLAPGQAVRAGARVRRGGAGGRKCSLCRLRSKRFA